MNKLLLSASVALGATSLSFAQQTEKPNFLLFIADDCSHYDLGCYGSVDSKTPNIDRFATQGVRFTQAYQAVPMSSPTRHNLYTGLWPVRSGAYPNHTCANEGTLSVVHHLQPLGYKVALDGGEVSGGGDIGMDWRRFYGSCEGEWNREGLSGGDYISGDREGFSGSV